MVAYSERSGHIEIIVGPPQKWHVPTNSAIYLSIHHLKKMVAGGGMDRWLRQLALRASVGAVRLG